MLLGLHHRVPPTPAQGSASPVTIHLPQEEMGPMKSKVLKREREGKVWNMVTLGVQGGHSGRFGQGPQ